MQKLMKRLLLLAVTAMLALALMAPATFAQDDDFDDNGDDDDGAVAQPAAMPDTGGPALLPLAGAALLGAGAAGVGVVRRIRR